MEARLGMNRSEATDEDGDSPGGRPSKELLLLPPPPTLPPLAPPTRWQLILFPDPRIGDVDMRQGGGDRGDAPPALAPAGDEEAPPGVSGLLGIKRPLMLRRLRFGVPGSSCSMLVILVTVKTSSRVVRSAPHSPENG